jgi:hypothetical protein
MKLATHAGGAFFKDTGLANASETILMKRLETYDTATLHDIRALASDAEKKVTSYPRTCQFPSLFFMEGPLADKFYSSPYLVQFFCVAYVFLRPFLTFGGPTLAWIIGVTLFQWLRGVCIDMGGITGMLCKEFFGVASFVNLELATMGVAALHFGINMLQGWYALTSAFEMYGDAQGVVKASAHVTDIQGTYTALMYMVHRGRPLPEPSDCVVYSGWGHCAVNVYTREKHIEKMLAQIGRVDACASKVLQRRIRSSEGKQSEPVVIKWTRPACSSSSSSGSCSSSS